MPVRNEEEYIRVSLQSLVDQSYPASECEIIVVEDVPQIELAKSLKRFVKRMHRFFAWTTLRASFPRQ